MSGKGKGKGKADKPEVGELSEAERAHAEEVLEFAEQVRSVLKSAGGSGPVAQVWRVNKGAKDEYLDQYALEAIADNPMEAIRTRHGGGEFRVALRQSDGTWIKGSSNLRFRIAGAPIDPKAESPTERKLDELELRISKLLEGGDRQPTMAELFRMQAELTREQLRELRNPPPQAQQANPAELVVSMMTAIQAAQAPLLEAMLARMNQQAPDPLERIDNLVGIVVALRDIAGGDRPKGWDGIADRLATPLGKLIDQHVDNQRNGLAPPSTMAPRQNPNGAPDMAGKPEWLRFLQPMLPQLVGWAAEGKHPGVIADFVATVHIPDDALGFVYEQLTRPTFLDELAEHAPETRAHSAWFAQFAERILEHVDPDPGGDVSPDPEGGAPSVAGAQEGG